jgi:hypothetical protein
MQELQKREKGITSKDRQAAVKNQHDEDLEKLEQELSAEASSSEESAPSETEETEEESQVEPEEESTGEEPAEEESEESSEESEEPEDVRQLSAKAQKRFRNLSTENNQLKEELNRLRYTVNTLQGLGYSKTEAEKIAPDIDTTGLTEITEDQYKQDVAKQARYIVKDELSKRDKMEQWTRQREWFQQDLETIEQKYPELNPDSDEYNKELDSFIGDYYERLRLQDPNLRVKDVAEKIISLNKKSLEKKKREDVNKLAKKASSQAIKSESQESTGTDISAKIMGASSISDLEKLEKELQ